MTQRKRKNKSGGREGSVQLTFSSLLEVANLKWLVKEVDGTEPSPLVSVP
jgi:hypothetical protein